METTKYTAKQVAKELTPTTFTNINGSRIYTHKENTELRMVGKETFIAVSGWLTDEGLVKTHIWYFTPENRDGDPTETYYRELTAQQVAVLYNHLIETAPKHGYGVYDKHETTELAAANEEAYDPEEIEPYTDHIWNILDAMQKSRKAEEAAANAEQIAIEAGKDVEELMK